MKHLLDKIKAMAEFDETRAQQYANGQYEAKMIPGGIKYFFKQSAWNESHRLTPLILAQNEVIEMLVGALEESCTCYDGDNVCESCDTLAQAEAKLKKVTEGE